MPSSTKTSYSISERTYLFIAIGLLGLYVLPYIWLGEGAYLTIHDNLDSDFLYLYLLKLTRTAFNFDLSTFIPNMMSGGPFRGIPRSAFRTGLNFEVLSFWAFPPYVAQVVNFAAVHGIGFWGMYALLRRYILQEPIWAFIRVAIAFLFALVPCYIVHGASVTGQPLLLFAFLNLLMNRARWTDWAIILLFPFYSFFVWAGLFVCVAMGVLGLVHMLRNRQLNWPYLNGLLTLSLLYLASEWELIYGFVHQTYISQRVEFDYSQLRSMRLMDSVRRSADLFLWPMFNTGAFLTLGILIAAGLSGWKAYRRGNSNAVWWLAGLPMLAVLICLIHGFYHYLVVGLGDSTLGLEFRVFQFDRFYFLLPTLWFILFAMALRELGTGNRLTGAGRLERGGGNQPSNVVSLFLALQFALMILANKEWRINIGKSAGLITEAQYPSFRAFFAEKQFTQIRDYIGQAPSSYRVICLGMHPSVAQFNGFYTLDSYQNNYPLAYKHAFRKIIATELAKGTRQMRVYYDAYACRAYLYTAELGMNYLFGKTQHRSVSHLQIDTQAMTSLNGQYVISAVPILNATANRLRLTKVFDEPESYWRIWLYKVVWSKGVRAAGNSTRRPLLQTTYPRL
ncbi:DUF6044 family protein [Spirosoma panaciterrae]|uniref:DUF6044 family protein n=1 Tax=Spirosoma panaciterrae TaxID=496058 RepID=UPI000378E53D|nr:DUF6044 family protein [Spirosoma panaciterrae]